MLASWKKHYNKPRQCIRKQRQYFANKGPYSQSYGFSNSESWIIKKDEHRIDAFEFCWRRLLKVPWTARSNQSIPKEINPEYPLKGLLLRLQYFGHLMWRANSLEKTLMLGKVKGKRRRGCPPQQRMRWLNSITDSIDINLSKHQEIVGASLVAQTVKCLSAMWEIWVRSLGWEDSLEKEMATHSSTLALKIPWTEELGAGYYPRGCKEWGTTERLHFLSFPGGSDSKESACNAGDPGSTPGLGSAPGEGYGTHSSILAWRIPWTEEPGEDPMHPWGCKESRLSDSHTHTGDTGGERSLVCCCPWVTKSRSHNLLTEQQQISILSY